MAETKKQVERIPDDQVRFQFTQSVRSYNKSACQTLAIGQLETFRDHMKWVVAMAALILAIWLGGRLSVQEVYPLLMVLGILVLYCLYQRSGLLLRLMVKRQVRAEWKDPRNPADFPKQDKTLCTVVLTDRQIQGRTEGQPGRIFLTGPLLPPLLIETEEFFRIGTKRVWMIVRKEDMTRGTPEELRAFVLNNKGKIRTYQIDKPSVQEEIRKWQDMM